MRNLTWCAAGAVCLAIAGGTATARAGGHNNSSGSGTTIKYVAHQAHFKAVNLGKKSFGPGDYFVSLTHDKTGSTNIGHDSIVCHINFGGYADCTGTTVLAKGQIVTAGEAPPGGDKFTLAIVGGTGAYKNATGTAVFHTLNDTDVAVTLTLS